MSAWPLIGITTFGNVVKRDLAGPHAHGLTGRSVCRGRQFPGGKWFSQTILSPSSDRIADVTSFRSPGLRVDHGPLRPGSRIRRPPGASPAAGRARRHHRRPGRQRRLPRPSRRPSTRSPRTTSEQGRSSSGTASTARSSSSRRATSPSSARTATRRASSSPNCARPGARRTRTTTARPSSTSADDVTDLVLANLTVRNDYGLTHDEHDHQFAIRSGGNATRISSCHAKRHRRRRRHAEPVEHRVGHVLPRRTATSRGGWTTSARAGGLHHQQPLLRPQPDRQHLARRQQGPRPEVRDPAFALRRRAGFPARAQQPRRAVLPARLPVLGEHGRPADLPAIGARHVPVARRATTTAQPPRRAATFPGSPTTWKRPTPRPVPAP